MSSTQIPDAAAPHPKCPAAPPRRRAGGFLTRRLRHFRRAEDGGMIVFALVVIMLMLFTGGMAVDLMRYEAERSKIQDVADRSALAAASLRQDLDPESVVNDYFLKAGLSDNLQNVEVSDPSLNYRRVRAETSTTVRSLFMHLMGVDQLQSFSAGTAEEYRSNVEISLVLDVSGSMVQNGSQRLARLKEAADDFAREILADDVENRVSITMVPYNGQIILPPALMSRYNVTHQHNVVAGMNCLDLPQTGTYGSIPLSRTTPMAQSGFADTYSPAYSNGHLTDPATPPNSYTDAQTPTAGNVWCNPQSANRVRILQNDYATLGPAINGMVGVGATSIDAGLKWGAALLDPSARPMIQELVTLGEVPAHFGGRPLEYNDPEGLKVIVLMTDGEHFDEERLNTGYRSGLSPIYRSWDSGVSPRRWRYSIHHPGWSGSNKYWVPHRNSGSGEWRSSAFNTGNGVTQLTWDEVWTELRVQWVAWQLYARALGNSSNTARKNMYVTWMNNFRTRTDKDDMDVRLNNLCTQIKAQRVLIFGIAFEAPERGINAIRNCASPDRFRDVDQQTLAGAFAEVRAQINLLRLTQ